MTKQWNDHPQELEVKTGVVKDLSESAATAISNARFLAANALPQAAAQRVACARGAQRSQAGRERCIEEKRDKAEAVARTNMETVTGWRRTAAALEARVSAYFEDEEGKWRTYSLAVERFLRLSTTECGQARDDNLRRLLAYLGESAPLDPTESGAWGPLFKLTSAQCRSGAARGAKEGYRKANGDLSNKLLQKRGDLLDSLRDADSDAFSSGLGDFVSDAGVPIVVGIVLAGLLLAAYPFAAWWRRRRRRRRSRAAL
ncbi:MAG TPA: hypothetical protein VF517_08225 [Thermoleophilaceae bacterium]